MKSRVKDNESKTVTTVTFDLATSGAKPGQGSSVEVNKNEQFCDYFLNNINSNLRLNEKKPDWNSRQRPSDLCGSTLPIGYEPWLHGS